MELLGVSIRDFRIDYFLTVPYSNLQIILVNDGSTDSSLSICKQFEQSDPRIEVISCQNGGVSKARNIGLDHAKGLYIGFVDSDDWVEPEFCMRLLKGMKQTSDICMSIVGVADEHWKTYLSNLCEQSNSYVLSHNEAVDEITKKEGLRGYLWNKMFENSALRLNESIFVCEDLEFVIRYITNHPSKSIVVGNACLYHYIKPNSYRFSYVRYNFARTYTRLNAYHLILGYLDNSTSLISLRLREYLCEYSFEMLVNWYNLPRNQRGNFQRVENHIDEILSEFIQNFLYGYKVASTKLKVKYLLVRYCPKCLIALLRIKDSLGIQID